MKLTPTSIMPSPLKPSTFKSRLFARPPIAMFIAMFIALMACNFQVHAFCGFYVGKADSSLFNEASQVAIVRDGDKTVLSMLNDYKGDLKEFALVVPVPTVLTRSQINVGDARIFARLDAYSAPRLAEYFDPNPCQDRRMMRSDMAVAMSAMPMPAPAMTKKLGVTVEAEYTIGEYDIVILSAKDSDGLETWLTSSGYKIPAGASKALKPYINQGLKFFVAKVNLKEQAKTGFTMLRPLQFAFESERFMLPIRLGMVNAPKGENSKPQDLIVFALTKKGRVESSNYRTQNMPANMDLPPLIKNDFKRFYKTLFEEQTKREGYKSVFTEYFWDMGWCDPCAADPLSTEELRKAGVFWLEKPPAGDASVQPIQPLQRMMPQGGGAQPVMLTRLHVRYTPETFPEDILFMETADRNNFQTRYVMRHPWKGNPQECVMEGDKGGGKEALLNYLKDVQQRQEKELNTLISLTRWDAAQTRAQSDIGVTQQRYADAVRFFKEREAKQPKSNWWDSLWPSK